MAATWSGGVNVREGSMNKLEIDFSKKLKIEIKLTFSKQIEPDLETGFSKK